MLTTTPPVPCSTRTRATAWATRNMPRRFTASIRSQCAAVISRNGSRHAVPALFARTSRPPRAEAAARTRSMTPASSLTSPAAPCTSPRSSRASTVARTSSASRPPRNTRQPSSRKRRAAAAPIPLLPPLTRTRLPARPRISLLYASVRGVEQEPGFRSTVVTRTRVCQRSSPRARRAGRFDVTRRRSYSRVRYLVHRLENRTAMSRAVPAARRALDILELFLDAPVLSAADVVRHLELPRTTVHELLGTLAERNYLVVVPGQPLRYQLGVRLFQLGSVYAQQLDLAREAQRVAAEVAAECDETVHVAILEGTDVIYIARVESTHPVRMISAVGRRLPAHCTGVGKMLLSALPNQALSALYPGRGALPTMTPRTITSLPLLKAELGEIRERGLSYDEAESSEDVHCVATSVRDHRGEVVAAMSISVPTTRWDDERRATLADLVRAGAARLSASLGHRPTS